MPRTLSHLALIVADPSRTARLLVDVFADAVLIRDNLDDDRHPGVTMKLAGIDFELIRGNGPASRNGDHVAFRVSKAEQQACARRLSALAIEYQMARNDTALYFSDYDNHVFELEVAEDDHGAAR